MTALQQATLMIGERTFRTGDRVRTPVGEGTIIGLDPFADAEIGVLIDGEEGDEPYLEWIAFRFVQTTA